MVDYNREDLVFLNDKRILDWEKPVSEENPSMLRFWNGFTKIKDFLKRESLNLDFVCYGYNDSPYSITASAVIYKAEIARLEGNKEFRENGLKSKSEEEILFLGGIQIYRRGIITGTEILGEEFMMNEIIRYAEKARDTPQDPVTLLNTKPNHLAQIILGNHYNTEKQVTRRIEMIIGGYKHQHKEEENMKRLQASVRGGHRLSL